MSVPDCLEPPLRGSLILRGRADRRGSSNGAETALQGGSASAPHLNLLGSLSGLVASATLELQTPPTLASDRSRPVENLPSATTTSGPGRGNRSRPGSGHPPSRDASTPGSADDKLRRACAFHQSRADTAEAELTALREGMKNLRQASADLQSQVVMREACVATAEAGAAKLQLQLDYSRTEAKQLESRMQAAHAEVASHFRRMGNSEEEATTYRHWAEASKCMHEAVARVTEGEQLLQAGHARNWQFQELWRQGREAGGSVAAGVDARGSGSANTVANSSNPADIAAEAHGPGASGAPQWTMDYEDILLRHNEAAAGEAPATSNRIAIDSRGMAATRAAAHAPTPSMLVATGAGQLPPLPPRSLASGGPLTGGDQSISAHEAMNRELHARLQEQSEAASAQIVDLEGRSAWQLRIAQEQLSEVRAQGQQRLEAEEAKHCKLEMQLQGTATRISELSMHLMRERRAAELAKAQSEHSAGMAMQLEAQLAHAEHNAQRASGLEAQLAQAEESAQRSSERQMLAERSAKRASQLEQCVEVAERWAAERGSALEVALCQEEASEGRARELETELLSMRMAMVEAMRQTTSESAGLLWASESREQALRSSLTEHREAAALQDECMVAYAQELRECSQAAKVTAAQTEEYLEQGRTELKAAREARETQTGELLARLEAGHIEAKEAAVRFSKLEAQLNSQSEVGAAMQRDLEAQLAERAEAGMDLQQGLEARLAKQVEANTALKEELEIRLAKQVEANAAMKEELEARIAKLVGANAALKIELETQLSSQAEASAASKRMLEEREAQLAIQEEASIALKRELKQLEAQLASQTEASIASKREMEELEAAKSQLQAQLESKGSALKIALGKAQAEREHFRQALEAKTRESQSHLEQHRGSAAARIGDLEEQLEKQVALAKEALQAAWQEGAVQLEASEARNRELADQLSTLQGALKVECQATAKMSELAKELAHQRYEVQLQLANEVKHHTLRPRDPESKASAKHDGKPLPAKKPTSSASVPNLHATAVGQTKRPSQTQQLPAFLQEPSPPTSSPKHSHSPAPPWGVSVHHFKTDLLEQMHEVGLDRQATLYDVEARVLQWAREIIRCPRDGRPAVAYVDMLQGEDHVGTATHVLSCPWDTGVSDLADALDHYCRDAGLSPKRIYLWHCCLCKWQRKMGRSGRSGCVACTGDRDDSFVQEHINRMASIGKVLSLVVPWDAPQFMAHAWCIAEMFLALSMGSSNSCELGIITPPADAARFATDLSEGGQGLASAWQKLAAVKIEDCKACDSQGTEPMMRFVQEGPGCSLVNVTVSRHLHAWLATSAESHLRLLLADSELDGEPAARICDTVGWLLREVSLTQRSAAMIQDGLQLSLRSHEIDSETTARSSMLASICAVTGCPGGSPSAGSIQAWEGTGRLSQEGLGTLETAAGVSLLSSMGASKWIAGDRADSLEALLEAKRIRTSLGTLETVDGAILLRNIGIVKWASGDHEGGLEAYAEARTIHEHTGSLSSNSGAGLLLNMGFAKAEKGDTGGSLEAYEEASRIYESFGGLETPSGATLLQSIGVVRGNRSDQAGALQAYHRARCIRERTGTIDSLAGAVLLRNTGVALAAGGKREAALEAYKEALALRKLLGALQSPAGASLLSSIGVVRAELGDRPRALEACREAKLIYENTGALRTPSGKALLRHLVELDGPQ